MNTPALLLTSLEKFSALMPFPMYWSDLEARVVGANRLWLKLMGVSHRAEVQGKTPAELYPASCADAVLDHERLVLAMRSGLTREDVIHDLTRACNRYFSATRVPLINDVGASIGIMGILVETTETRLLQQASKDHGRQLVAMQEDFTSLAAGIAHDLASPLHALKMMVPVFDAIPESQRSILDSAVNSISDLVARLQHTCRNTTKPVPPETEEHGTVLLSDLVTQVVTQAALQYRGRSVTLETAMANHAQLAFVRLQSEQFKRALATLIGNAVEALSYKDSGTVHVGLDADAAVVKIEVQDNGKGLNYETLHRMLNRARDVGETNVWTGMEQVWTMLDDNIGSLQCETLLGQGTVLQLIFPRAQPPEWIAHTIPLTANSIIVVLDNNSTVHEAWQQRFFPYLEVYPNLKLHSYTDGRLAQELLTGLSAAEKQRVVFLCDDQLSDDELTGLQLIEDAGAHYSALVTSHYMMPTLRHEAATRRIKILPKQLAGFVPIQFRTDAAPSGFLD